MGDAIAISMQSKQRNIVDPIPRVDWRWGIFFCRCTTLLNLASVSEFRSLLVPSHCGCFRRGYVNVVDPIGLVVDSGEVVTLHARSRQRRRLFIGAAPFRLKYHLASTYRNAAGKLTSRIQSSRKQHRDGRRGFQSQSWFNAKARWLDAAKRVKRQAAAAMGIDATAEAHPPAQYEVPHSASM